MLRPCANWGAKGYEPSPKREAWQAELDPEIAKHKAVMDPHDKLQNEVSERLGEADRSIPRTPPKSLEGIAIVLRFVRDPRQTSLSP